MEKSRRMRVWGSLCQRGHDGSGEGHSLRYPGSLSCVDCTRESKKNARQKAKNASVPHRRFEGPSRPWIDTEEIVPFEFLIRPGFRLKTELPEDMTQYEACRLGMAVMLSSFSYNEEELFQFLHKFFGPKLALKLMELEGYSAKTLILSQKGSQRGLKQAAVL